MTLLKINLTLSERINQILSKLVPYLAGVILEKEKDNEGESYWMVLEEILLALSRL